MLEFRTRTEQMILGNGEFEITESMVERHNFPDEGEPSDQIRLDSPSVAAPHVPSTSSTLTAAQRTGWGWAGEIRFLTDSERAMVKSKERHEM